MYYMFYRQEQFEEFHSSMKNLVDKWSSDLEPLIQWDKTNENFQKWKSISGMERRNLENMLREAQKFLTTMDKYMTAVIQEENRESNNK